MGAIFEKEKYNKFTNAINLAHFAARSKELHKDKLLIELYERYKFFDDCLIDIGTGELIIDYKKGIRYTEPFDLSEWKYDLDRSFAVNDDCLIDITTGNVILDFNKFKKRTRQKKRKFANSHNTQFKKYDESTSEEELKKICSGNFDNHRSNIEVSRKLIDDLCINKSITPTESKNLKILCELIQRKNVFIMEKERVEKRFSNKQVKLTRILNALRDKNCLRYQSTGLHQKGMIKVVINPSYAWKGDYLEREIERQLWFPVRNNILDSAVRKIIESDIRYTAVKLDYYGTSKFAKKETIGGEKLANFGNHHDKVA
ncbi:hypothetical protein [Photobacterium sp. J15]|uniref:hypothetical protein n=1 Tax=Photobacterium sp. J15 TaxID=265901 RepID=UPI0007E2FCF0|nr:hypothetical protein [Photobacterium sp. J15]